MLSLPNSLTGSLYLAVQPLLLSSTFFLRFSSIPTIFSLYLKCYAFLFTALSLSHDLCWTIRSAVAFKFVSIALKPSSTITISLSVTPLSYSHSRKFLWPFLLPSAPLATSCSQKENTASSCWQITFLLPRLVKSIAIQGSQFSLPLPPRRIWHYLEILHLLSPLWSIILPAFLCSINCLHSLATLKRMREKVIVIPLPSLPNHQTLHYNHWQCPPS